ncbi:TIM barrel protein [Erwinia piriflorinigrans]|uniref:Inosose isomerase n=1 Tax=Erwinia piriflorinigrans CFBP 5888 TaxID=1161919 RepID=V5ZC49_9GAMM|nr:TIM barrel protein [Erwinia piriflorinigrans]CCG88963.1 inosose isomerase [Erwinia piriflorinigrans CFBP 5888]
MAIDPSRFCINRKIAPALSLEAFFQLVSRLDLHKIELRNDMKSGSVTDNLSPHQVRKLAEEYELDIVTINALYPFNRIDNELLDRAESLLQTAQAIGAGALVMCPLNDGTKISADDTQKALSTLAPLFARYGINGLVEPLGFSISSLRSAGLAQQLIAQAGVPFKILVDSFHHHLYEGAEQDFAQGIDVKQIGLVHLSGVVDKRPVNELTDDQRLMLHPEDRLKSVCQVQRLEEMGYRGIYAFEPFSPAMENWQAADIEREIRQSLALLQD